MLHDPNEEVETVKVVAPVVDGNPHGYIVINKADLAPEHQVFGQPVRRAEPQSSKRDKKA